MIKQKMIMIHHPASGGTPRKRNRNIEGKLILDATVAPQAIRYPTDLSLLNEAREFSEQIIDELYPKTGLEEETENLS